jgi:hypothetical protein
MKMANMDRPIDVRGVFAGNTTPGFAPTTTAYTTGDVLGGLITFPMPTTASGLIVLTSAIVLDNDTKGVAGDLYLFNALPTTIADNAVFAGNLVLADWLTRQTKISFSTYDTDSAFKTCEVATTDKLYQVPKGNLYGYFVITGSAPTFGSNKTFDIRLLGTTQ